MRLESSHSAKFLLIWWTFRANVLFPVDIFQVKFVILLSPEAFPADGATVREFSSVLEKVVIKAVAAAKSRLAKVAWNDRIFY